MSEQCEVCRNWVRDLCAHERSHWDDNGPPRRGTRNDAPDRDRLVALGLIPGEPNYRGRQPS